MPVVVVLLLSGLGFFSVLGYFFINPLSCFNE